MIEYFLRNELDRLPFETMNDMAERTSPIQGGVGYQVEWDNCQRTMQSVGEVVVDTLHPKQFAPQPGIYTGIADMDWFIVKVPTTKEAVKRNYGKDLSQENESEPQIRGTGEEDTALDAVTLYVGYARSEVGIDKYVWVNDVELEDLEDYQARRQPVCTGCGRIRPLKGQVIANAVRMDSEVMPSEPVDGEQLVARQRMMGMLADRAMTGQSGQSLLDVMELDAGDAPEVTYDGGACPWCGGEEFRDQPQEYEQVILPVSSRGGVQIPGAKAGIGADGMPVLRPTLVPFYKPDVYPVVIQKNVSKYGQLLGSSDVDAIADQQNTINRLEQKVIDRLMKAGTRVTLPDRADLRLDPNDTEKWYIGNPADKSLIDVYSFSGDLQYELAYIAQVYEEARQILGITDSFQGRRDPTATSGVAKEHAAAQAAGRLESKRIMKNAAYSQLFELMFKFWLAYSDEPRPISYKDANGDTVYEEIDRYDFLEQDADGNWVWNDQFLFSVDSTAPLAGNREALWQETRMNLQTGAFGDPTRTDTLILFWSKMEEQHYPGAATTKSFLEQRLEQERAQAAQMQQAQMMQQSPQGAAPAMPMSSAMGG